MEIISFQKYDQQGFSVIGKMCDLNDYQHLRSYFDNIKINKKKFIIDLSRLTFSSSHGLGLFIEIAQTLQKSNTEIYLYKPREEINTIISLVGLDQIIPILRSEKELRNTVINEPECV
ncbi:MAG: STAS domain-containing protein [Chitinispirillia bacterium]|jgi:anti-anti-sigma factor